MTLAHREPHDSWDPQEGLHADSRFPRRRVVSHRAYRRFARSLAQPIGSNEPRLHRRNRATRRKTAKRHFHSTEPGTVFREFVEGYAVPYLKIWPHDGP